MFESEAYTVEERSYSPRLKHSCLKLLDNLEKSKTSVTLVRKEHILR